MEENSPHIGEEPRNPHVRHEPRDVNAIFLTKFGLGMLLLILVFMFGLTGLFLFLSSREAALNPAPPSSFTVRGERQPPQPRLQPFPARDMREMRAAEDQAMQQYGWVDPDKGTVRIPVARAMDLIAQRGLPAWQPAAGRPSANPAAKK
jgi:hypothetical protein